MSQADLQRGQGLESRRKTVLSYLVRDGGNIWTKGKSVCKYVICWTNAMIARRKANLSENRANIYRSAANAGSAKK